MNQKKKTIILLFIFAIVMICAFILYQNLSTSYKMDSLSVEEPISEMKENNNSSFEAQSNNSTPSSTSSREDKETTSEIINLAPDFTVYDLDGNQVHLSDFFGKPIIINFWASWCGPCQMEMPDFENAFLNYQNEIVFLMINMTDGSRETFDIASSFITEKGYHFPVYYDTDYSAAITYSVSSLPTTYFLNAKGELIAHAKGAIDAETLKKGIDMIYPTIP